MHLPVRNDLELVLGGEIHPLPTVFLRNSGGTFVLELPVYVFTLLLDILGGAPPELIGSINLELLRCTDILWIDVGDELLLNCKLPAYLCS